MSASLLHNARYEFSRPTYQDPLSPPDTDSEVGPSLQHTPESRPNRAMFGVESGLSAQAETPTAKSRRVSTLAYHSSLREPQERSVHKSSKSLVVIIPPDIFSQEHGRLGHTLSSGSRNRLSQGILMPLLPTVCFIITLAINMQ